MQTILRPKNLDICRDATGLLRSYAWPGGYDIAYIFDADGSAHCASCANAMDDEPDTYIVTCDTDDCFRCNSCGRHLSAYCTEDEHSEHCSNH